jgi:K+ transporter
VAVSVAAVWRSAALIVVPAVNFSTARLIVTVKIIVPYGTSSSVQAAVGTVTVITLRPGARMMVGVRCTAPVADNATTNAFRFVAVICAHVCALDVVFGTGRIIAIFDEGYMPVADVA